MARSTFGGPSPPWLGAERLETAAAAPAPPEDKAKKPKSPKEANSPAAPDSEEVPPGQAKNGGG
jgi:hypothetical protein